MTPYIRKPEFCPRPGCPYYDRKLASRGRWYTRFGSFSTRARGEIPRFRCTHCGKTCSTQTFSLHYWTHSTTDYHHLWEKLYSGSGLRQQGRFTNVSFRVVQNRIRHLARNCLALTDRLCAGADFCEDVVMDGFESFTRSQYFPNNITLTVGADSQFIHGAVHTLLRRKGRMSARQLKGRSLIDAHWKPAPAAVRSDCTQLLSDAAGMIVAACRKRPLTLATDRHKAYPAALRRVAGLQNVLHSGRLTHLSISSRAARTIHNPLFAVNYVDRQIRKNMGEHVRETVKQGREVNCQMERMAIFIFGHNFLTPHRIRDGVDLGEEPTHAVVAGIAEQRVKRVMKRLFIRRHLWGHEQSRPGWQRRIWQHEYENPPAVNLRSGKLSKAVVALPPGKLPMHFLA